MKGTESLGLCPSLLLCVMRGSEKSSIRSKGPRMTEISETHNPLKKFCDTSVTSPVWNVGRCLSEAGPCKKGFSGLCAASDFESFVYIISTMGRFVTSSSKLLVCCSFNPGVSLAVGPEGGEEISKCLRSSQRFHGDSCVWVRRGIAQAVVLGCVTISCLV